MRLFAAEEFASRRRAAQSRIEEALRPTVQEGVDLGVDTHGWADVLDAVAEQYEIAFAADSDADAPPLPSGWRTELLDTLHKTTAPRDETTVNNITIWLATWVLSQASLAAAATDDEDLLVEWVDMNDGNVRPSHARTSGQQRPPGEPFDVDGVEMPYPGWPGAPIELWINCRCTLRPVLAAEFTANASPVGHTESQTLAGGGAMDEIPEVAAEEANTPIEDVIVRWHGVLAPEAVRSGDRRRFGENSLTMRPAPLPLTWQRSSAEGHDGSVTVAKIERIVRVGNEARAEGSFIVNAEADEVMALIAEFGRFGVSVDADDVSFELDEEDESVTFTKARIASASIVSIPAFAQAWVSLGPPPEDFFEGGADLEVSGSSDEALVAALAFKDLAPGKTEDGPGWLTHPVDTDRLRDYWTRGAGAAKIGWGTPGDFNRCRMHLAEYIKPQHLSGYCANRHYDALGFWPGEHHTADSTAFGDQEVQAAAVSLVASTTRKAPHEWFLDPEFTEKTHLTVTEEGEVFGHIATWDTCHGSFADECVLPPRSPSNYSFFATGQVLTDKGLVNTGPITVALDPNKRAHAPDRLRMRPAIAHYENTCAAVADVAIGEDAFGIWVHGWVRPGATEEQVAALRASDVSGDWRMANGGMELIAALAVNSGGFHTPRVAASIHNGQQVSLVAAGFLPREGAEKSPDLADFGRVVGEYVAKELAARESRRKRMAELAARVRGE